MKRFFFALTLMTGLLLPLAPRAQADPEVSLNFFYDNLSPYGNWIEVADYGYCFQPNVAVGHDNWRPYSDGYWAYTDDGWTWVSYEDFGWATYHYGRWTRLTDYGWVWVPGYEWGPAWVSWRTGGDYVGWAPLPPAADRVYEGRAISGHVDVEFDIGPRYYNFVDVRYIGEPVLRERILPPERNVTIINRTVNVTNITYSNSTVYNYGPDYNRLNQYSARPIQRLSLRRETAVGPNFATQGGGGHNFNRVIGNQLTVVAPAIQRSQQRITPHQVKAQVKQPRIEHGWTGISNRQQIQAEMKKENANQIASPSFQPQKGRKQEAAPIAVQNAQNRPNNNAGQHAAPAEQAQSRVSGVAERRKNANQEQAQRAEQQQRQKEKEAAIQAQRDEKRNANRAEQRQQRHEEQAPAQKEDKAGQARRDQEQQSRRNRAAERQKKEPAAQAQQEKNQNALRPEQRQQRREQQGPAQEKNKARHEAADQAEPTHKAKAEQHIHQPEVRSATQAEPAPERAGPNNHARQQQRAEHRAAKAPDQDAQSNAHKKQKKKAPSDEKPEQP